MGRRCTRINTDQKPDKTNVENDRSCDGKMWA
jgi:hypothetical protein